MSNDDFDAEMSVGHVNCLHFTLPVEAFGVKNILIAVEYCKSQDNPNEIFCRAWAQVNNPFIRGLVDELNVPAVDEDNQLDIIVSAFNESKRFNESLIDFIKYSSHFDCVYPDSIGDTIDS